MSYQQAVELLIQLTKDAWLSGSPYWPRIISREEAEQLLKPLWNFPEEE